MAQLNQPAMLAASPRSTAASRHRGPTSKPTAPRALGQAEPEEIDFRGVGSGDIDARDVKAQEAAEGCAEYERPQEYRQYR
jgi:hypothetical protein